MRNLLFIVFLSMGSVLRAQSLERQVIGNAGAMVSSSNSSLSYTVGEVATFTSTNAAGTLNQGFQQPEEEEFVSVVEIKNINATAVVFPNPAVEVLKIKSDLTNHGITKLNYRVLDIQGKAVLYGHILSNSGEIVVSNIAKATYIIELKSDDGSFIQHIRFVKI